MLIVRAFAVDFVAIGFEFLRVGLSLREKKQAAGAPVLVKRTLSTKEMSKRPMRQRQLCQGLDNRQIQTVLQADRGR